MNPITMVGKEYHEFDMIEEVEKSHRIHEILSYEKLHYSPE